MSLIPDKARNLIGTSDSPVRVEVSRREIIKYSIATEQRLKKFLAGDEAPPMFLFGALRPLVAINELGPDGIATTGLLPDLPLKRVMAGGTKTRYFRPIKPGDVLVAVHTLSDIYEKRGSKGDLIFVVYTIDVRTETGERVAEEVQTRIVR